jgi:hypothetical protein
MAAVGDPSAECFIPDVRRPPVSVDRRRQTNNNIIRENEWHLELVYHY